MYDSTRSLHGIVSRVHGRTLAFVPGVTSMINRDGGERTQILERRTELQGSEQHDVISVEPSGSVLHFNAKFIHVCSVAGVSFKSVPYRSCHRLHRVSESKRDK